MDINSKIKNPKTGRNIKVSSALQYDENEPVYKKAKSIVDREDQEKPIEKKQKKEPSIFIKKYGKLKLNAYPNKEVNENDVQVDLKGDIHSHCVLKWKDPKTGREVRAYTQKFLKRNAKIKWKRVKSITQSHVDSINKKSISLLKNKDNKKQDAGAIISIIAQTGLRPGSKIGIKVTGNRGVSTLGPKNIKIENNKIILNFIGKSYQENNAEFENKELADFLKNRIENHKDDEFIFDINESELHKVFKSISKKGMKIKDLRTYTATKMAKEILEKDKMPPPPLPDKQTKIKKIVKEKLKNVFEKVSQRLNNTPAMAKSSYIHPEVIDNWLKSIGLQPQMIESKMSMGDLILEFSESQMNEDDLENCDEYPLPNWWNNEKIQLTKTKVNESKDSLKSEYEKLKSEPFQSI